MECSLAYCGSVSRNLGLHDANKSRCFIFFLADTCLNLRRTRGLVDLVVRSIRICIPTHTRFVPESLWKDRPLQKLVV